MKRFSLWLLLALLLGSVQPVRASVVRAFTLPQLARAADTIVVGTVSGTRSFFNEARDAIYTEYDITVERTLRGTAPELLHLRLMGGRVGEIGLTIAGNAELAEGERVLLVLRQQKGFHTLVGMSQGKWSIRMVDGAEMAFRGPSVELPGRQPGEEPLTELLERLQPGKEDK